MIISITGTPGTGKTTLAKTVAEKVNGIYIDGNSIIDKYDLSEGTDKENDCIIVDEKKFAKAVLEECKENKIYIIDSHLSHHLSKEKVDLCIVCRCDLKILKKRLEERKYSEKKVKDNLDAEIFETCLQEAQENNHIIIEYYQTKKEEEALIQMILSFE